MTDESARTVSLTDYPRRHANQSVSPFRYPGGKGFLAGYLANFAKDLNGCVRHYVEPFCGGAGAALILLQDGLVEHLHLNDLDPRVYCAWRAITEETERFVQRILTTPVTLDTWRQCRAIVEAAGTQYDFDLAFATYFINRTSRSGIVLGSGPIGGYEQNGRWKIDARYYPDSMAERVRWIGANSDRITLSNEPAISFLQECAERLPRRSTLYFVDPPYVGAGSRLYLNAMSLSSHRELASLLRGGTLERWILTYDDDPLIRKLYNGLPVANLQVNYSLRTTRKASELLIHA